MFPNPQDALPLPPRPNLDQYKKLAKDLLKAAQSFDPKNDGVIPTGAVFQAEGGISRAVKFICPGIYAAPPARQPVVTSREAAKEQPTPQGVGLATKNGTSPVGAKEFAASEIGTKQSSRRESRLRYIATAKTQNTSNNVAGDLCPPTIVARS